MRGGVVNGDDTDLIEAIRVFGEWLRERADRPLSWEDRKVLQALYIELRRLADAQ